MNFFRVVGKIERIRFYLMLFVVGVLFVVLAIVGLSMPKPELLSTEGVIERIEFYEDADGEEMQDVFVSYVDDKGNSHENIKYPAYSSSMKEGDTVTILFDPSSPEHIQTKGGEVIPYIFLVIGIIAIVISILKIVAGKKKLDSNSPFDITQTHANTFHVEQERRDDSPMKDYYFHWTGKMNQSYILETPDRKPVYEAICDHMGVVTPYKYTFINRITGKSHEHKVSHTITSSYGRSSENSRVAAVTSSSFKIDGIDNWEYLGKLGYSIVPKLNGIKLNFDVLYHGMPIVYLEAAGTNILSDNAKTKLGDKLPGPGLYKLSCKDEDIEGVFLACFCASRVEFF